ncbi:YcfL family protein [Shewanella waksmanii]|uniref:YcfL family protein n=1 Tax=Shewanella waksmanii TaxID=213783 RepID=UPI0037369874
MKHVLVMLSVLLVLVGCAPHTAGIMASSTGESRIDNRSFANEVTLTQLKARPEGGLLQGAGLISSQVATDLRLQYKFTWFDAADFAIEDEGVSWKSVKLHGKQQMQVVGLAPNANAVRYEIYVRKAFSN